MCGECRRSESQKRQQADENLHVSSQSTNFCVDDYFSQQLFCQPILNQTRHTGTPSGIAVLWPTLSHGERRTPRDGERPSSRQYTRRAVLVNAESTTAVGSWGSSGTTDSNVTDKKCPLSPPAFDRQARSEGFKSLIFLT